MIDWLILGALLGKAEKSEFPFLMPSVYIGLTKRFGIIMRMCILRSQKNGRLIPHIFLQLNSTMLSTRCIPSLFLFIYYFLKCIYRPLLFDLLVLDRPYFEFTNLFFFC